MMSKEIPPRSPQIRRIVSWIAFAVATVVLPVSPSSAQLPPEAVDLALVKIPETLTSEDICPVHLVPADARGESWSFEGVDYRGSEPGSKAAFMADPGKHAEQAARERWIKNFMLAMSTIWCPITDEVTPGGRLKVEGLDYTWESCCSFCDEEMKPENFTDALEKLRERAEESFDLIGSVYVADAKSPVEGAIKEGY